MALWINNEGVLLTDLLQAVDSWLANLQLMSADLDDAVQTQMVVSLFRSSLGREYHGNTRIEVVKPASKDVFLFKLKQDVC
ncbi:hypothetical protein Hanom_Chr16g01463971 [Helianthus anomalus]